MLMAQREPSIGRVELLDALSRTRPLTDREVRSLQWALDRKGGRHERWYWSRADDYRLIRHLLRGKKPAQIAILMSRTERAVWRRLSRLGINVRRIDAVRSAKSSIANGDGK